MAIGAVLSEDALRDAVAYLKTLGEPGGGVSRAAGRDIYQAACVVCHGTKGDGKGPLAATLPGPAPRDFTDERFVIAGREEEVARVIGLGAEKAFHGSTYMPEWSKRLSEQQIRDVVAYLRVLSAGGS
jgi:mono/diheme cytochrome c family protein